MPPPKFKVLVANTRQQTFAAQPARLYLSRNAKTGVSINTAIAETCRPTPGCGVYCYGLGGHIGMPAALRRQRENTAFFRQEDWAQLQLEAVDMTHLVAREQSFLRMFGVGDLQRGSVYFINQLATYAHRAKPALQIWVSTRKFELAAQLVKLPNLHVMLSFDSTTPAKFRALGLKLLQKRRPQFFAAWVRCDAAKTVPAWVDLVFEEHKPGKGRAARAPHPKACPATVDETLPVAAALEGACAACTYCFNTPRRAAGTALVQLRQTPKAKK